MEKIVCDIEYGHSTQYIDYQKIFMRTLMKTSASNVDFMDSDKSDAYLEFGFISGEEARKLKSGKKYRVTIEEIK